MSKNFINFIGQTMSRYRNKTHRVWYGTCSGTPSAFILSVNAASPSTGLGFSTKDYKEMIITCVAQGIGATYSNLTNVTVLLQHYNVFALDWVTLYTLNVGPISAGPAGNGSGTFSFGNVGTFTNFGNFCRVAIYGTGTQPGAGEIHVFAQLKG